MTNVNDIAEEIVGALLGDKPPIPISEASVHRPPRGRVWVAAFTGPHGGQTWRSTGLTDRDQALLVAKKWEGEARAERAKLGRTLRKPTIRVCRSEPGTATGPLTQREVATLLGMSERGVREVERRAFRKIRNHPLMKKIWQQYLAGELDEEELVLTPEEVEAVLNAAQAPEEWDLVEKVLAALSTPVPLATASAESPA